jgi:hypothetical protein
VTLPSGSESAANWTPLEPLVEREGKVRSQHVATVNAKTLKPILATQISKHSYIRTDDSSVYPPITGDFAGHGSVNHSAEEYVRAYFWHTNTAENYFSILKRGINGVYHHVSEGHLHRYLTEFDFRYNQRISLGVNDDQRMARAAKGVVGKRLTYRRTRGRKEADETIPVLSGRSQSSYRQRRSRRVKCGSRSWMTNSARLFRFRRFAARGRAFDRRMPRRDLYGTLQALHRVGVKLDIVGVRRGFLVLHGGA